MHLEVPGKSNNLTSVSGKKINASSLRTPASNQTKRNLMTQLNSAAGFTRPVSVTKHIRTRPPMSTLKVPTLSIPRRRVNKSF